MLYSISSPLGINSWLISIACNIIFFEHMERMDRYWKQVLDVYMLRNVTKDSMYLTNTFSIKIFVLQDVFCRTGFLTT